MPAEDIQSWSTTAATNATADTGINWAEGQPRASVNNSARSMMAAVAKDRNLKNGSITTGGTANAQTFTSGVSYITVSTGLTVRLKVGVTNTGATTLNMDSIGAVTIKDQSGADVGAGALTIGRYVDLVYNGTNWILLQAGAAGAVPHCGRLVFVSAAALSFLPFNGDLIKINGSIFQIPSGGITGLGNTGVFVNGLAAQPLIANTTYNVYAFNNAGVITADFRTGAHSTSTTAGNVGVEILTGDDTRTLIGKAATVAGAPTFSDTGAARFVISWFNRRNIPLAGALVSGTTTSAALVEIGIGGRSYFLTWGDEGVSVATAGYMSANVIANTTIAISLNGGAVIIPQNALGTISAASYALPAVTAFNYAPTEGANFFTPMGSTSAGTGSFNVSITGMIRGDRVRLIPLPIDAEVLRASAPYWLPFLLSIARRTKESVQELIRKVTHFEVRLTLLMDDDDKPLALFGVRLHMRGNDLIAEWVWMTGQRYKTWVHMLPEFEQLLKQAGVVECRLICRPGWAKILKPAGYRLTHYTMEKVL